MKCRRIAALALAVLTLALPFAGCRKQKTADEEQTKPQVLENVFRGTVYPLPEPFSVEERSVIVWDAASGKLRCVASGGVEEEDAEGNLTYTQKNAFFTLDENGVTEQREIENPAENGYIQSLAVAGEDIVYLWEQWDPDNNSEKWFLGRVDGETGERTNSEELSKLFPDNGRDWFYINYMCADGDGDIYLNSDQEIVVVNRDFIRQFSVSLPGWVNTMTTAPDGVVWVTGYINDAQSIAPIDKASKNLGKAKPLPDNINQLFFGEGHDFFYANDTGVWAADLGEDGKYASTLIMNYLNSNISRDDATLLAVPDDTTVLMAERTDDEDWRRSPAVWRKAEDVDLSAVKVIEIAISTYLDSQLPARIVKYNREHPEIRVILTDYQTFSTTEDWQAGQKKLAMELVNGVSKPDIVVGSPTNPDISAVLSRKLYTDLTPYTEADDVFNPGNLFGSVKSAFTAKDGTLWGLTSDFNISTLLSTPALLGKYAEGDGWTLGEMMDFAVSLPEGTELMAYMTQDTGANLLSGGYGAFIDEAAATCNFEDPAFIKYLEFMKTLPKDWEEYQFKTGSGQSDYDEIYRLYHEGKIALKDVSFWDFSEFLNLEMAFGTKDYTMIGYPKSGEGTTGALFNTSHAYVITKYAQDPAAAWDVMKTLIDPAGAEYFHGLPPIKSAFDKMSEEYYTYRFEFYYDGSASWGSYDPENDDGPKTSEDLDRPGIVTFFTEEDAARIKAFLDQPVNPIGGAVNEEVSAIIQEEISALTGGSVDAEGCAKRIQSRVGIWLAEHK